MNAFDLKKSAIDELFSANNLKELEQLREMSRDCRVDTVFKFVAV